MNKVKKEYGKWLEEYGCGCTFVAKRKKDLIGYCGIHGNSRKNIYLLSEKEQCGLSSELNE